MGLRSYLSIFTFFCMLLNTIAYTQLVGRGFTLASKRHIHIASTRNCFSPRHPHRWLCQLGDEEVHGSLKIDEGRRIKEAYSVAAKWLQESGLEDAEDSARHLISHATRIGTRFSDFHNNSNKPLTKEELQFFSKMCQQRANREPVQYIIGNWDFYGMTFECKPPTLIPRPETEELVENILQTGLLQALHAPRILDVGAGTGAIGIALLSQLPNATCCSIDINAAAVELALRNADYLLNNNADNRYNSYHCDFRSFVKSFLSRSHADQTRSVPQLPLFDLIVSNPPYIPTADIAHLQPEIREFEDAVALDGGADGLDIVRDLIYFAPIMLSPTGTRELWLEVSEAHPAKVEAWLKRGFEDDKNAFYKTWLSEGNPEIPNWNYFKPTFVSGITDLVGNPRFIRLKF